MADSLHTYVALLRGINVGGNTIISMAGLKKCFEALGFKDVKTYINSGNVIFRVAGKDPRKLEAMVEQQLAECFSFQIRVIVKDLAEISYLISQAPASWSTSKDQRCNVIFLHHTIDRQDIIHDFSPKPDIEELHYHPGALLWSAQTSSLTKSGMLKVISMPIYKQMTIRIFNTVKKIHQIMQQTDNLPNK